MTWWGELLVGLLLMAAGFVGGAAFAGRNNVREGSPEHLRDLVAHKHLELENAVEVNRRLLAQRDEARRERDAARHQLAEAETREIYLLERLDLAEGAGR